MKIGEIWKDKETDEQVRIDYIEHNNGFDYVGYTYLERPLDHETPETEEMIIRSWFIEQFKKCR